jgi:hypothetical protein
LRSTYEPKLFLQIQRDHRVGFMYKVEQVRRAGYLGSIITGVKTCQAESDKVP